MQCNLFGENHTAEQWWDKNPKYNSHEYCGSIFQIKVFSFQFLVKRQHILKISCLLQTSVVNSCVTVTADTGTGSFFCLMSSYNVALLFFFFFPSAVADYGTYLSS